MLHEHSTRTKSGFSDKEEEDKVDPIEETSDEEASGGMHDEDRDSASAPPPEDSMSISYGNNSMIVGQYNALEDKEPFLDPTEHYSLDVVDPFLSYRPEESRVSRKRVLEEAGVNDPTHASRVLSDIVRRRYPQMVWTPRDSAKSGSLYCPFPDNYPDHSCVYHYCETDSGSPQWTRLSRIGSAWGLVPLISKERPQKTLVCLNEYIETVQVSHRELHALMVNLIEGRKNRRVELRPFPYIYCRWHKKPFSPEETVSRKGFFSPCGFDQVTRCYLGVDILESDADPAFRNIALSGIQELIYMGIRMVVASHLTT